MHIGVGSAGIEALTLKIGKICVVIDFGMIRDLRTSHPDLVQPSVQGLFPASAALQLFGDSCKKTEIEVIQGGVKLRDLLTYYLFRGYRCVKPRDTSDTHKNRKSTVVFLGLGLVVATVCQHGDERGSRDMRHVHSRPGKQGEGHYFLQR